ncbi:MAG: bacillithiol system redox-active protein YtxJ [Bacteroidota bacterium]
MKLWQDLEQEAQLDEIRSASFQRPQLIFKHSIACGTSAHMQHILRAAENEMAESMDLHYLDLITFRPVSNLIATSFGVPHQSPQALLIRNGEVIHHSSHFAIQPNQIIAAASQPV